MEKSKKKELFAEERLSEIVKFINSKRRVTVAQLCEHFTVSSATMRNDLKELGASGLITRTHGGAILKSHTSDEPVMDLRKEVNLAAKQEIATIALALIDDGDSLILDTGTTALELAKLLRQRNNLTVVTNDFSIAAVLEASSDCRILLVGGLVRKGFHCTVESGILTNLRSLSVDKAFLGTNAISPEKGASTPDPSQSAMKNEFVKSANQLIILGDETKLGFDSFVSFATPEQIDILVTDRIPRSLMMEFENIDIEVRVGRVL